MKTLFKQYDIVIYTDGACRGNPGPGSIAYCIVKSDGSVECMAQYFSHTTNNIAELSAVIMALERVLSTDLKNKKVKIFSDSQYVVKGATEWLENWIRKDFKKVMNPDLWRKFTALKQAYHSQGNSIEFEWVKGHGKDKYNLMVDLLCNMALDARKAQSIDVVSEIL